MVPCLLVLFAAAAANASLEAGEGEGGTLLSVQSFMLPCKGTCFSSIYFNTGGWKYKYKNQAE